MDVSPTAPASITNTIPAANLTNAQGLPGATAATGTLTVSSSGTSTTKAFSSGSAARLTPVTVTLTFRNATAVTLTSGTFTDNLPQTPIPMAGISTTAPTFTNCGASPSVTFSNANTVVNGSGLSVAAGATCTVKFAVNFLTSSPTTQTDTNYLRAANVVFLNGATPVSPPNDVFASLNTTTSFVVKNYLASAYGLTNAALTVQGQIVDQAGPLVTDTNASATFVLNNGANHNVKLAPAPNFIFGNDCPGGLSSSNVTIGSGGESFTVNIPSLNSSCTITYNVINEVSGATGTFTPGTSWYTELAEQRNEHDRRDEQRDVLHDVAQRQQDHHAELDRLGLDDDRRDYDRSAADRRLPDHASQRRHVRGYASRQSAVRGTAERRILRAVPAVGATRSDLLDHGLHDHGLERLGLFDARLHRAGLYRFV